METAPQHIFSLDQLNGLPVEFEERIDEFRRLLYSWNALHNLTRVPEESFHSLHLCDSLVLLATIPALRNVQRIADIGTGAGFPGIPLALALPDVAFTLVDKTEKRLLFIEQVCSRLNISNITLRHGRLEQLSEEPALAGQFDVVMARALAPLEQLVPLAAPFCHTGGSLVFLKSLSVFDEYTEAAAKTCEQLGFPELQCIPYLLPDVVEQKYVCVLGRAASSIDPF
jgi:16S rRNA (guanine527-N7)-methyltransferase